MISRKRLILKVSLGGVISWTLTYAPAAFSQAVRRINKYQAAPMSVKILHPPGEIIRDQRWAFLIGALDRTTPQYGPYVIEAIKSVMSTRREVKEAIAGTLINVIAVDCGHPELNESAIPIPIPIDRGLLGYRVGLIRRDSQKFFNTIKDKDGLKKITIGQGNDWGDVPIYQLNDIPIVTSGDYPLLFAMLLNGRFDLFPRGLVEVIPEFEHYRKIYPNIAIENHLLIKYDYGEFFYVSQSYPKLAQRISDGLNLMLEDGSFEDFFQERFAHTLRDLQLNRRVFIRLQSPSLPAWVPVKRKDLWFNPIESA